MTPKLLRLAYAFEFLVALVAIFTAWSEIGGQAALDVMNWAWKLTLSFGLAASIVAYTAALTAEESLWTLRTVRWLSAILVIAALMGAITYYYMLQEDTGGSDDNGNVSASRLSSSASFRTNS
jgi:hypothetical protein